MYISFSPLMLVSATLCGGVSSYLAYKRGRNPFTWFAIGFLFGVFGIFAFFFASPPRKPIPVPKPEPVLTIHGPSDKFWYYLDLQNQQQGPMSLEGLKGAWKQGKVDLATYIWHEELTDWKPLKEVLKTE
jgi:hypothetical protein